MTPFEIRTAIAIELGWTKLLEGSILGQRPNSSYDALEEVPHYESSLDACAEFEKDAPVEYWAELQEIVMRDSQPDITQYNFLIDTKKWGVLATAVRLCKVTPLQRCEAFLCLKGKWKD